MLSTPRSHAWPPLIQSSSGFVSHSQLSVQEPLECVLCRCRQTSPLESQPKILLCDVCFITPLHRALFSWTETEIYFSPSSQRPRALCTHPGACFDGEYLFCSFLKVCNVTCRLIIKTRDHWSLF